MLMTIYLCLHLFIIAKATIEHIKISELIHFFVRCPCDSILELRCCVHLSIMPSPCRCTHSSACQRSADLGLGRNEVRGPAAMPGHVQRKGSMMLVGRAPVLRTCIAYAYAQCTHTLGFGQLDGVVLFSFLLFEYRALAGQSAPLTLYCLLPLIACSLTLSDPL